LPVAGKYCVTHFETGHTIIEGDFSLAANDRKILSDFGTNPSQQALYLIEWEINGKIHHNHYVAGKYPFTLAQFSTWMQKIASLNPSFEMMM